MKTIWQRLEHALRIRGVRKSEIAEKIGVTPQAITKWKETGHISRDSAIAVCRALDIDFGWFLTGEGPSPEQQAREETTAYRAGRRVPVVGTAQLGDDGFFVELEHAPGHGDGAVRWSSRDPNAYAVRCRGDSMRPRIKPGEFVVIEPNRNPVPGDEVLVRDRSGRVMVKEWLFTRDGQVHLMSVNASHGRIVLAEQDVELMHYVAGIAKGELWDPD